MRGLTQALDNRGKSLPLLCHGGIDAGGAKMAKGRVREFRKLIGPAGETYTMSTETIPSGSYGRRFVTLFPETLMMIARDPKKPGATLSVFVWALDALDFERWHTIRQVEVAGVLACSTSAVSEALRYLADGKLLELHRKVHGTGRLGSITAPGASVMKSGHLSALSASRWRSRRKCRCAIRRIEALPN
jgi:hypothetical protein